MPKNLIVMQGLKYATLTLVGMIAVILGSGLLQDSTTLTGRLVSPQQQGVTPSVKFDAWQAIEGFSAPADTHVIFTIPEPVPIARVTFLGGPPTDVERYWGYCFTGNEAENKRLGKRGKELYDGKYFYSLGERRAQEARPNPVDSDLQGILESTTETPKRAPATVAETFYPGDTCYVMSSIILPSGMDADNDNYNNAAERLAGTHHDNPDTDGEGIADGVEVFRTKTNPLQWDSDLDGLSDRCEDTDMDGPEIGETAATVADTDRDGLCDGNGLASGCPEPRQVVCFIDRSGDRVCDMRPSGPVRGEDMNQNCKVDKDETDPKNPGTYGIPDWDYKWNQFKVPGSDQRSDAAPGTIAPEFPIPNLPMRSSSSSVQLP